ncbi:MULTISPECIES: hypothetical protein [Haloferax]|uniref:Uncharacterized protein n=1 Tax=Haloferax marinum TaxID=2666143 RepID=A0A6A8G7P3_9EURY|nr:MULTISPECIES: hypothetical protein [Haloferax]KAB1197731.1 hypothetical protein Hfx1150_09430 [Haloferax sp. CBA1150]MRW96785.1 hypothetical protein [Haloferax marinum]
MVSAEDIKLILKRRREAFYLLPLTFGYFYHEFNSCTIWYLSNLSFWPWTTCRAWFYLMVITGFTASVMYIDSEIREDLGDDFKEVELWVCVEIVPILISGLSLFYILLVYSFKIDWTTDFWLAALGFANVMYGLRWITDKIYAYKYDKHYSDL